MFSEAHRSCDRKGRDYILGKGIRYRLKLAVWLKNSEIIRKPFILGRRTSLSGWGGG
jgi:hypothetical protein